MGSWGKEGAGEGGSTGRLVVQSGGLKWEVGWFKWGEYMYMGSMVYVGSRSSPARISS